MRIIAGSKRGMKLLSPKTDISRPIIDRVKESLFSVLYKYGLPEGKKIADLFSGVGSLGIEALSRGAEFVTFVDNDPNILKTLERNIEKAGFVQSSKVIKANAFKFILQFDMGVEYYDLIFIDPPYLKTRQTELDSQLGILLCSLGDCLAPNGIVVVRTEKKVKLLEKYKDLRLVERRHWGNMAVSILEKERINDK
ncbi:MAG: 16S rRNA (guanine(966)-N(2))-methyltransferase RsmD [Planctomycetota bacterium]|jgi:16S rRNA (guanine966-N2)-methyltransferase